MMTVEEFIAIIPSVLLYVVPGFVVFKMVEMFAPKRKQSQFETILWSIFWSFVVSIIASLLFWIFEKIWQCDLPEVNANTAGDNGILLVIYLVLAICIGAALAILSNSKAGDRMLKKINPNMGVGEDFWFTVLKSDRGIWAKAYLKNGLLYIGVLRKFTSDPHEDKMILLTQTKLVALNKDYDINHSDELRFFKTVEDHGENEKAKVLLRLEEIVSLELIDTNETEETV